MELRRVVPRVAAAIVLLVFGWLLCNSGASASASLYPPHDAYLHLQRDDGAAADSPPTVAELAYCGDARHRDRSRRLLYVSTLDGTLTALDLRRAGAAAWHLRTGASAVSSSASESAPLLSSSIHRFELTNDGRMVRMIPSLYGGLYKFDGDAIEQIPVTAADLLSSSYKFSEDLVISGGKETRSYGVSARTGRIVYECSMAGCRNHTELRADAAAEANLSAGERRTGPPRWAEAVEEDADADDDVVDGDEESKEHDPLVDDIVLVRRETQTVRAVEPRTGGERWNFSVGHHELELLKPVDCRQTRLDGKASADQEGEDGLAGLELHVLVPDGLVYAVSAADPATIVWQHKFSHPIVAAWRVNAADEIEPVNLFGAQQFPVKPAANSNDPTMQAESPNPSVYVGMYQRQLYIQESGAMKKQLLGGGQQLEAVARDSALRIPWKPQYALTAIAVKHSTDLATATTATSEPDTSMQVLDVTDDRATALSVLYATEYVNGNGFYLYTEADLNRTQQQQLCDHRANESRDGAGGGAGGEEEGYTFPFADDDGPTQIIIVSLWFWWKEIMVISLTTALILNVVLSRRLTAPREVVIVERHVEIQVPVPTAIEAIDAELSPPLHSGTRRSLSDSSDATGGSSAAAPFVSRYAADFEMVQCLGKGGFGVVFESKNKLDDCRYAIKRIQLPNRRESRERVMREVKTLAHCEHQNIVRYFQAWVETPPAGWQEQEDRVWMAREALSHSVDIDSPTMDDGEEEEDETSSRAKQIASVASASSRLAPPPPVVFSKVINRRERGLDAWITGLNTNECLNFDDDNRKTSFVDADTNDTSIRFADDGSFDCNYCSDEVFSDRRTRLPGNSAAVPEAQVVFTDETQSSGGCQKRPVAVRQRHKAAANGKDRSSSNNDSFQIVFQNPTTASPSSRNGGGKLWSDDGSTEEETEEDTSEDEDEDESTESGRNGAGAEADSMDDSFSIEFRHSTNGGDGDTTGQSDRSERPMPIAIARATAKQRTISEHIVSNTCGTDAFVCKAALAAQNGGDAAVIVDVGEVVGTTDGPPPVPFRKTHRRPLSLDLTAASRQTGGRAVELFGAGVGAGAAAAATQRMYLYIQMQLCKKQSLKDWLRLNDLQTRQRDIVSIFRQIVDGVEYCHLKGLIHRDLKPGNIFFALDGQIKIGDFGLVTGMASDMLPATPCGGGGAGGWTAGACAKHTQQVGTHLYMSPEQVKGEQYSYKVDVYSLGVIFFELLRCFGTEMERIETLKALRLGVFPRDFVCDHHDEYNLLKLMLSQSPDERPTTIGIRARPPLGVGGLGADTEWHFRLPPRRRDSQISGLSQNGGGGSSSSASASKAAIV